jgi:hypothetical protein
MNMNIAELLDRYWEGETTLTEEQALKEYFASGAIRPEHQQFAPLFEGLAAQKAVQSPVAAPKLQVVSTKRRPLWRWAVAASVAMLLSAGVWQLQQSMRHNAEQAAAERRLFEDTYTEAEALQAAEEIKAALALVSRKMKKGNSTAAKGLKKVEVVDQYFKK